MAVTHGDYSRHHEFPAGGPGGLPAGLGVCGGAGVDGGPGCALAGAYPGLLNFYPQMEEHHDLTGMRRWALSHERWTRAHRAPKKDRPSQLYLAWDVIFEPMINVLQSEEESSSIDQE